MSVVALTQSQWTDRIRRKMAATVEQIIEVGVDLEAAKAQLGHGRFGRMLSDLEMDPQMAQRFMRIAGHEVLANTSTWTYLPASYRTLAELARIEPLLLERAITDGEVTRETRTRDAEALYQRFHGKTVTTTSTTTSTTYVPPEVDRAVEDEPAPLADENGEPLPSGGEPREDAEVSDGAGPSDDEGVGDEVPAPTPSAPTACPTCGGTGTVAA